MFTAEYAEGRGGGLRRTGIGTDVRVWRQLIPTLGDAVWRLGSMIELIILSPTLAAARMGHPAYPEDEICEAAKKTYEEVGHPEVLQSITLP